MPRDSPRADFDALLVECMDDIETHGFDSTERLEFWMERIYASAVAAMMPVSLVEDRLHDSLRSIYRRMVTNGGLLKYHQGIPRFTVDRLKPHLRAELDRVTMASIGLIKLNRQAAVEKTVQRLSGWITSVPAGGSRAVQRMNIKQEISKPLSQLSYVDRRLTIDQGHKFISGLNRIIANDNGAIAMVWHSHFRQAGYNYRPDHRERDGKYYAIRGCWALERGFMNKGDGYADEMTAPAEEVYCRCFATYVYTLGRLPAYMLTRKGEEELVRVRALLAA